MNVLLDVMELHYVCTFMRTFGSHSADVVVIVKLCSGSSAI